jgi:hypothetical protein
MITNWNTIIDHYWAVALLQGAMQHGRIGHAYLITGVWRKSARQRWHRVRSSTSS